MTISEQFCCFCLDVATGSILTGIYTSILSLVFLAVGIDCLVETYRAVYHSSNFATLNAVYGLLIGLSVLFGIASVSLVLGASGKLKTYILVWMVLAPIWSIVCFCSMVALPMNMSEAVILTDFTSTVWGTSVVLVLNIFCMICVCIFFATLVTFPAHKLKSLGVVEALESGFSNGYSRLRESFRPSKSKEPAVSYRQRSTANSNTISIPEISVSVVLSPNNLEVARSGQPRRPTNKDDHEDDVVDVGDKWTRPLSSADQLSYGSRPTGFVNAGFATAD